MQSYLFYQIVLIQLTLILIILQFPSYTSFSLNVNKHIFKENIKNNLNSHSNILVKSFQSKFILFAAPPPPPPASKGPPKKKLKDDVIQVIVSLN